MLSVPKIAKPKVSSISFYPPSPSTNARGKRKIATPRSRDLLSADSILKTWEEEASGLVEDLIDGNPISFDRDNNCLCRSLSVDNMFFEKQRCRGCELVSRFLENPVVPENGKILIQAGEFQGESMLFRRYKGTDTSLELKESDKFLVDNSHRNDPVEFYFTKLKHLNYIIVSLIVAEILNNKNFPAKITFLWGYICGDKFNIIDLVPNLGVGSLKKIVSNPDYTSRRASPLAKTKIKIGLMSPRVVDSVIRQLVTYLSFLSDYYFTHGTPCLNFLGFSEGNIAYSFRGVRVTSDIYLHVIPSGMSGVSYFDGSEWKRFYSSTTFNPVGVSGIPIERKLRYLGLDGKKHSGFRIGKKSNVFKKLTQHHGGIISSGTFDFICFMCSLMIDQNFRNSFEETEHIDFWKSIWKPSEYKILMTKIKKAKDTSFNTVFTILKDRVIQYDALDAYINQLRIFDENEN